jgi:hypothetical protein
VVTVRDGVIPIAAFYCAFLCAKGLNAKDIHKKFPVYGGKCFSCKVVHSRVKKFPQGRLKVTDDETEVRNWLRQQSRTSMMRVLMHWQRDGTGVSMLLEDMLRNKYFFPGSNITCFAFYSHL